MIYFIYPNVDIWEYIVEGIKDNDVVARPLNPNCYKWQMILRKLFNNSKLPSWCLFGRKMISELRMLKKGDTVMISDYPDICLFKTISSIVKPEVRKCLWIWNPVKIHERERMFGVYDAITKAGFEISTFDKGDAERYSQKQYSQFFRMNQELSNVEEIFDFYFIGFEKNRKKIISELQEKLKDYRCLFKIINNVSQCIPYEQNIENIKKSRCIIEIVQEGQEGITLRPLEAIAMRKKLLTNNSKIKKQDFYSPRNIFIIGEDDFNSMKTFLDNNFENLSSETIEQYSLSTWLKHFK